MTEIGDAEAQLKRSLHDVRRAFEEAQSALSRIPDPHRAFEVATELAEHFRELADDAADLRALTVNRIWEAEATSLAGLAEKIGVSKARAGQLMKSARSARDRLEGAATGEGD